jgi:hypothetical protein
MKAATVLVVVAVLALVGAGSVGKVRELMVVRLTPQHAPGALAASVEFVAAGGRDSQTTLVSW